MAAVAVRLLSVTAAFALFKLAMYAQPFILGTLVLGWRRMCAGYWKWAGLAGLIALVPLQFGTQKRYIVLSATGPGAGGATPGASQERMFRQLSDALRTPGAERFVVPLLEPVTMKMVAACSHGRTLWIPIASPWLLVHPKQLEGPMHTRWEEILEIQPDRTLYMRPYAPPYETAKLNLHDPVDPAAVDEVVLNTPAWVEHPQQGDFLLDPPERYMLFNRVRRNDGSRGCLLTPLADVHNHLIWKMTTRSRPYDPGLSYYTGLFPLQPDPAFPRATFAPCGRHLMFQVLNPSARVRMLASVTATYLPGEQTFPDVAAVGERRAAFPFVGQGAGRVVSEPFSLQRLGNDSYAVLELGLPLTLNQFEGDQRQISVFVRNVSLLSEEEYAARKPPECVRAFPAGLADPLLEFSGCGEDGSVGKRSWFRLSRPDVDVGAGVVASLPVTVKGRLTHYTPQVEPNVLIVKWDGVEIARQTIVSDAFEVRAAPPGGLSAGKLELEFSESRTASSTSRGVSAQLTFVGFARETP